MQSRPPSPSPASDVTKSSGQAHAMDRFIVKTEHSKTEQKPRRAVVRAADDDDIDAAKAPTPNDTFPRPVRRLPRPSVWPRQAHRRWQQVHVRHSPASPPETRSMSATVTRSSRWRTPRRTHQEVSADDLNQHMRRPRPTLSTTSACLTTFLPPSRSRRSQQVHYRQCSILRWT